MASTVIVGAQWGDEGKGKIVDLFTRDADLVVRFQGGNNAGHTLVVDTPQGPEKTILHLIPSGILYPEKTNVIGTGVTVDVEVLFQELDGLARAGRDVAPAQLRISRDAHVTMPYHRALDIAREAKRCDEKIGTTGRGIGPSYEDRASRRGVRVRDLLDRERLASALRWVADERNALLAYLGADQCDLDAMIDEGLALGERLAPFVTDTVSLVYDALLADRNVLFEGAQGTLLDVSHGTYPFVTSSNTISGGVCIGAGVAPSAIGKVVGVAKAYVTRVGSGPFPTELLDGVGDTLRANGHEFGSTTGRPRRCGWFDAVVMRTAHRLNGFTGLAITKLDVLTGLDTLKICTAYDTPEGRIEVADLDARALATATPVYESMPGWSEPVSHARSLDALPAAARAYLDRLAELCGVPVTLVSVGPERGATISLDAPFG